MFKFLRVMCVVTCETMGQCHENYCIRLYTVHRVLYTHQCCGSKLDPDPDICSNLDPDPSNFHTFTQLHLNFGKHLKIVLKIIYTLNNCFFLTNKINARVNKYLN